MTGSGDYISREAALRDWPLCDEPGDAYQFIRNFPAADVRPRWIPVSERLPEEYVNVLCHLRSLDRESEYYSIDHLMEDGQWWKAANSWKHEVTHWMPLPEPPKEE